MQYVSGQHASSISPSIWYLHSLKLFEILKCSSFDHTYLIVLQMSVGGKRTSLSNQLLWFNFNWHWLGLLNDWNDSWKRTRGPRDFALSQQRMISMQAFLMKTRADFSLILSSVRLPQQTLVRVQHACDTYRRLFSELSSILKTLSYFRALKIFQMHYKDSTSPWLFLVYIWVSLNQGKRAVTCIGHTQPINYIRHWIIQAILQKRDNSEEKCL